MEAVLRSRSSGSIFIIEPIVDSLFCSHTLRYW